MVVGLAVPICYGITLGLDLFAGYTINRVTLFALILALGLLVDDPITGVDNIERYLRNGQQPRRRSVIMAIREIRGALIMSTIAIIISFAPLRFITGMMGPYMAPMDFNGMVRHYFMRYGAHYADIRVTLAERQRRSLQSHAILLRIRKDLEAIAEGLGARIKLVEVLPGPPVISTITLDPIFSGLAWAIIFGLAASTVFTLFVIPVLYNLIYADKPGHGLPAGRDIES